MNNKFTSFTDLAKSLDSSIKKLENKEALVLIEVWSYLQKQIKWTYWVYQPWWAISTTNPDTPLVDTWELKESVKYKLPWNHTVVIKPEWTLKHNGKSINAEKLATIHEYWTIKIPARPIWRNVIQKEENNVHKLVSNLLDDIF